MADSPNVGPDGIASVPSSALYLGKSDYAAMVAHCIRAFPEEGCGLLIGELSTGRVRRCVLTRNAAASSRLYTIDSKELLQADRSAEEDGLALIGVFHSHTHTDAYPSPTDVDQAFDPGWHYVLISLRNETPSLRSYRIVEGKIMEEPVFSAS